MVEKILLEIRNYLNVKNNQELAEYLGVSPSTVYSWTKRGRIGNIGLILAKNPEINGDWLKSGDGNMIRGSVKKGNLIGGNAANVSYTGGDSNIQKESPHTEMPASIIFLNDLLEKLHNREEFTQELIYLTYKELKKTKNNNN